MFLITYAQPWSHSDWLALAYDAITLAAVLVALFTLRQIKRQGDQMQQSGQQTSELIEVAKSQAAALAIAAEAAKRSAEAATANAIAIINSERPWIFVNHQISQINIMPVPGSQASLPDTIHFSLTNSGRTPAELAYMYFTYRVMPSREVDDFSINEEELGLEYVHKDILAPQQIIPFDHIGLGIAGFSDEELLGIAASRVRLVLIGMVRYRDSLGSPNSPIRDTWFQYFFDPTFRRLVMCGKVGSNKHT